MMRTHHYKYYTLLKLKKLFYFLLLKSNRIGCQNINIIADI